MGWLIEVGTLRGVANQERDEPPAPADTVLDPELIAFLSEWAQSSEPLTAEEFARALKDKEAAMRLAALKLHHDRERRRH